MSTLREGNVNTGNYWSNVLAKRISRRRALVAAGPTVAGAAFLAACGGDSGSKAKGGVLTEPEDTFREAKRGGRLITVQSSDYFSFDPTVLTGGLTAEHVFSRLIRLKPGYLAPVTYSFTGDVFDSWEVSPDKLTLTGKVRPNFTWHRVSPVNGRPIDAEDVVQGVKRYAALGPNRSSYFTEVNPDSPITSWSAIDNRTVSFKLKEPSAGLLGVVATEGAGLFLTPKEVDGGYDPRSVAIGSGNWQVAEWQPSSRMVLKRHEGHYEKDRLYIDERQQTILPEYATRLAQLRTGAVHGASNFFNAFLQEDILGLKADAPDLQLYKVDPPPDHAGFKFGWNPALGEATPFRDKRLRQALAYSIDRDLVIDTVRNISRFKDAGIELEWYVHSCVQANSGGVYFGRESYWLDPKSKNFGPNAKFYQRNLDEAKKLLSAAGQPNGLNSVLHYSDGYGTIHARQVEIIIGMAAEAGIKLRADNTNLSTEFRPKYANPQGDYDGVAVRFLPAGGAYDPPEVAIAEFTPHDGISFTGFFGDGGRWKGGDPKYSELLFKTRQEFDEKRRFALLHEFQRMEAENQYQPRFPGTAQQIDAVWPAVRNYNVFRQDLSNLGQWLDSTKKPISSR